jgi:hypothetical protein
MGDIDPERPLVPAESGRSDEFFSLIPLASKK